MSDQLFKLVFDDRGRVTAKIHAEIVNRLKSGDGLVDGDYVVLDLGRLVACSSEPPPTHEECEGFTVASVGVPPTHEECEGFTAASAGVPPTHEECE